MEFLTLNTGAKMPLEGFGVFQIPDPAQCEQVGYCQPLCAKKTAGS